MERWQNKRVLLFDMTEYRLVEELLTVEDLRACVVVDDLVYIIIWQLAIHHLAWCMISSAEVLKQTGSPFKLSPSRWPSFTGVSTLFAFTTWGCEGLTRKVKVIPVNVQIGLEQWTWSLCCNSFRLGWMKVNLQPDEVTLETKAVGRNLSNIVCLFVF